MTAATLTACIHCATPCEGDYCCTGCAIVHRALSTDELPAASRGYTELDDPAFERIHVRVENERCTTALYLEELRCTSCVWVVENARTRVPGVIDARVDLGRNRVDVIWDPMETKLSAIASYFDRVGHRAHPYRGIDRDAKRRAEDRAMLVKLGVAGAAMGNSMLLAIALYAGADASFFRHIAMLVAVPALSFAATPFFKTAIGALRARRLHLDLPLSIGIVAGLSWGTVNVLRGGGEIYFDSLSMLVFLLLVARWVVLRHQRRASSAAELLWALTPSRARRRELDGSIAEVPIEAIRIGDRIVVAVGDRIPVDAEVVEGASAIDAAVLTGESRPVDIAAGATVHAGTVNLSSPIELRATAVGEATRLGALANAIASQTTRKAEIERLVDRMAARFVVVVTIAASLTLLAWSVFVSPIEGAEHAMALLVVTCPCALALATPLAVTVAMGRSARRGILIKGADALERMATPGTMFVDKTGTLTAGKLALWSWQGTSEVQRLAAAVEAHSRHPIARALATDTPHVATEIREHIGRGISGRVGDRLVLVGSPAWVRERADEPPAMTGAIAAAVERTETPVSVAVDGVVVGVAGLVDPVRPGARDALEILAGLGWHIEILSGDDSRVVREVGRQVGIAPERCRGNTTPEGKLAAVRAARERGRVAMVGDGVNDAPAMAASTCGIAVSGATELAIEVADIYLQTPSIEAIAETALGAGATLATIRRSLRRSLAYNLVAGTLAITGVIGPLVAAIAMPASSLVVLLTAIRSRAFR